MERKRKSLSQPSISHKRSRKDESLNDDVEISEGRAGRILRVYLKNFMCHSVLEVNLNPNTNFIVGRNGSGKSAILTALIVGLGGKARTTNRGKNMKGFIKLGQTSASVEITLTNTGPMAYNPKDFGDRITITRSFTETSNSYKLKSETGHVISTSFKEVCRLIETLNIQVDNPVCILNQDVARTFLNANDPRSKYLMFMKATNLENVKQQNIVSLKNKTLTFEMWQSKNETLRILEKDVKKLLQKYNAFQNLEIIELRKEELNNEAIWAQINTIEQEIAQKESIVEEINKEIENYTKLVQNKGSHRKDLEENIKQIEQQLLEIRNEEEVNQSVMTSKRTQLTQLRDKMVKKKTDITSIENVIKRKLDDQKTIQNEITNSSELQQERLRVLQERDQQIASLENKLTEISKLVETGENDLQQTMHALKRKQQEENNLRSEMSEVTAKVRQRQAKIRTLKSDENNSTAVYGAVIQRIVQSINACKEQFKKVPKGPIGSYIKLKDKKWALAVEDFISRGMLVSFCVDNSQDGKLLSKIINENCGKSQKPTIINSRFINKVHDYMHQKVKAPQGTIALIDALTINDPVIKNCLIDQLSIEHILLISTNELARQLMSNKAYVPKNCSRAVSVSGDQFYPDPSYRSYACRNKNPRFLQVSTAEAIKMYEEELDNIQQNETTIQGQLRGVSEDVAKLSSELKNIEKNLSKYDMAQHRTKKNINEIKTKHVPPEANLKILSEEMEELTKIIQQKENTLEQIKGEIRSVKDEMTEVENGFKELKQVSKHLETRINPLIQELEESKNNLKQININAKFNTEKIKRCKEKLENATKESEKSDNILQEKMNKALLLGPKIHTTRQLDLVLEEMRDIDQQIMTARAAIGDRNVITESYLRLQQKYDKTKEEMDKVKICLDELTLTVENRTKHFNRLSEYIGVRVREMFIGVLKIRRFKGTLEIDHEQQKLDMVVFPQHGSSQGTGQTHILSGGERSYSTVAFLHALWQVMEYPFYFLDEFDVFMDKVNRRTVMDILISHATEHNDLQFVFLTPQDISGIVENTNVSVYKMPDPNRNNVEI